MRTPKRMKTKMGKNPNRNNRANPIRNAAPRSNPPPASRQFIYAEKPPKAGKTSQF
jgi:hypothetical protein